MNQQRRFFQAATSAGLTLNQRAPRFRHAWIAVTLTALLSPFSRKRPVQIVAGPLDGYGKLMLAFGLCLCSCSLTSYSGTAIPL